MKSDRNVLIKGIRQSLEFLESKAKRKLITFTCFQIVFSALDLVAVILIGAIGSMAILGIQSKESRFASLLKLLQIQDLSFQQQIAFLSIFASILLITKTCVSAFMIWKTNRYYSFLAVSISEDLIDKFLKQPINRIGSKSTQQSLYGLISGVNSIVVGVVANLSSLVSDSILILLMLITLFVADPIMAILALVLFGTVAFLLHFTVGMKSRRIAEDMVPKSIELNERLLSTFEGYRELFVSNRLTQRQKRISDSMTSIANLSFRQSFLPHVSKFIIEIILVISIVILSSIQFLLKDVVNSASTIGLFLAASSRIAPAALRLQQGVSGIMNGVGGGKATIELRKNLDGLEDHRDSNKETCAHSGLPISQKTPVVRFDKVSFSYKRNVPLLKDLTFQINQGERVLMLGKSGEGKSTLVDLLLGLLFPDSGEISILGKKPRYLIERYPNMVSYMPQHPYLFRGTIRENISDNTNEVSDGLIWKALEVVQMKEYIESIPGKLDFQVSENGKNFSGGQRQRLCLARTLLLEAKIVILDEATSALDSDTESKIMKQVLGNKNIGTLIVISHKLDNFKLFDKIGIVDQGIFYFGNKSEVSRFIRLDKM